MKKKFMCLMLAFLLSLSFVPTAFAASDDQITANGRTRYYNKTGQEVTTAPALGGNSVVSVNKTIEGTDKENEFSITLDVKTTVDISEVKISADAAVVLVLDVSGSMGGSNPSGTDFMPALRNAAINFVKSFNDEAGDSVRYISLVTFASDGEIVLGWTDISNSQNLTNVNNKIGNLKSSGSTNLEGGLRLARNLLRTDAFPKGKDGKPIENRSVIVFSDGDANMETNTAGRTVVGFTAGTKTTGTGSQYSYEDNPGKAQAQSVANVVKNDTSFYVAPNTYNKLDSYIFTIAFGAQAPTTWLKDKIATDSTFAYTAGNASALNSVFAAIAKRIESWAEAWTVTDPMGQNIEFASAIPPDATASGLLNFDNNTLYWDLKKADPSSFVNNIYTYTYKYLIRLDTTKNTYTAGTSYPTNGKTDLSYVMLIDNKIASDVFTADFAVPAVKGYSGGNLNFVKVGGNNVNLADCEFRLINQTKSGHSLAAVSAQNTGAVTFANIPSGHTYQLREISIPDALKNTYILSTETFTVTVANGVMTIRDSQGNAVNNGFRFNNPLTANVYTGDPSNVLESSATIINNTYAGITGTINFVAIQYSTDPSMSSATTVRGTVGSPFSVNLTGLKPETDYYYRAGVNASSGSYFGEIKKFTTPKVSQKVFTGDPVNVLVNRATIINNTYTGITGTINFVAIQYSTSPTMAPATTVQGTIGSPFTVNLTGLQPNTTYYYRAGVSASSGANYGEIKTFTTPQILNYYIDYYVESIDPENHITRVPKQTPSGTVITLSRVELDAHLPYGGYMNGVQVGGPATITTNGQIINVLYGIPALRTVTVRHLLETGYNTGQFALGSTSKVSAADGTEVDSIDFVQSAYLKNYRLFMANPAKLLVNADNLVIDIYYKKNAGN